MSDSSDYGSSKSSSVSEPDSSSVSEPDLGCCGWDEYDEDNLPPSILYCEVSIGGCISKTVELVFVGGGANPTRYEGILEDPGNNITWTVELTCHIGTYYEGFDIPCITEEGKWWANVVTGDMAGATPGLESHGEACALPDSCVPFLLQMMGTTILGAPGTAGWDQNQIPCTPDEQVLTLVITE